MGDGVAARPAADARSRGRRSIPARRAAHASPWCTPSAGAGDRRPRAAAGPSALAGHGRPRPRRQHARHRRLRSTLAPGRADQRGGRGSASRLAGIRALARVSPLRSEPQLCSPGSVSERATVVPTWSDGSAHLDRLEPPWARLGRLPHTPRGRRLTKGSLAYVWCPVASAWRAKGGRDLDLYELRHACATPLLERGLAPADVAVQLGHTDGGRLVMTLYGHPDERRARDRLRMAFAYDGHKSAEDFPFTATLRTQAPDRPFDEHWRLRPDRTRRLHLRKEFEPPFAPDR